MPCKCCSNPDVRWVWYLMAESEHLCHDCHAWLKLKMGYVFSIYIGPARRKL